MGAKIQGQYFTLSRAGKVATTEKTQAAAKRLTLGDLQINVHQQGKAKLGNKIQQDLSGAKLGPRPDQNGLAAGPRPDQNGLVAGPRPDQVGFEGPRPDQNGLAAGPRPDQVALAGPRPDQNGLIAGPRPDQGGVLGPRPDQGGSIFERAGYANNAVENQSSPVSRFAWLTRLFR